MLSELKKILPASISVLLLYGMVIIYQGYTYGIHDQSQILPVIYANVHPDHYTQDFYVQSYLSAGITERTVFHFLYRWLGYSSPWLTFFWHLVASFSLILGLLKVASLLIRNAVFQILAIGVLLTIAFHFSLGGNELYYPSLIPSLCAKSLCIWGIYYWLKRKYMLWAGFLIGATLLHPLAGLQVFLITTLSLFSNAILHRNFKITPLKSIGLYSLLCLPWIGMLLLNNGDGGDPEFFKEVLEFRLAHHFIPSSFPISSWIFTTLMSVIAMTTFRGNIRRFCFIIVAGCFIYFVLYENFNWIKITYSQWYKATIWLEFFGVIALFRQLEKPFYDVKWIRKVGFAVPVLLISIVALYRFTDKDVTSPAYDLPWKKTMDPRIQVSLLAKDISPIDAQFVVPYDMSEFSWYSKRSQYINYKAMLHQEPFLREWYRRMQLIYQYNLSDQKAGFKFSNFANTVFNRPAHESIMLWKQLGITHFICRSSMIEGKEAIGAAPPYYIFETAVFTD